MKIFIKIFTELKEKIYSKEDLEKFSKEIKELERKITIFHAKVIKEISAENKIELIGFHGRPYIIMPKKKFLYK